MGYLGVERPDKPTNKSSGLVGVVVVGYVVGGEAKKAHQQVIKTC